MATKRHREHRQKVVFVMIDGLADVAIARLGHKTPLQAADVPTMDAIARSGINGLMDPVEPGLACGSDTAHLSILGYPPRQYYRGRGAFESMGAGLDMNPGDIAFKSNFATIDPATNIVVRRRCDRDFEHWGKPLCDALTGLSLPSFPDCRVDVKYATEHRCGVRVRGPNLTDTIRDTDPLKDNLPLQIAIALEDTDASRRTAKLVNELSACIQTALTAHPINIERAQKGLPIGNAVLLRGCGSRISVQPFVDRHGFKPFMIAPTCIIAGLGMSLCIDVVTAPGATGDYHTNLRSKAEVLVKTLTNERDAYTFGFLHVKAVDDAGHDKNVPLKVNFLERIDREFIISALAADAKTSGTQYALALTGDHSTPVEYGDHSCEPVPFALADVSTVSRAGVHHADPVIAFSEIDATHGLLGRFPGGEVMSLIKHFFEYKGPAPQ